jgi:diadenosine tetraphosphate (Ap4A) HIT family hydrolase
MIPTCIFCQELALGRFEINVPIWAGGNFVVLADIAPVSFGHVIILPIRHFSSAAHMPPILLEELSDLVQCLAEVARNAFDFVAIAEHGSNGDSGLRLGCVEHAHVHLCPLTQHPRTGVPLIHELVTSQHKPISSLRELSRASDYEYTLWGSADDQSHLTVSGARGCSQVLRRVMSTLNGQEYRPWQHSLRFQLACETAHLYRHLLGDLKPFRHRVVQHASQVAAVCLP